MASSEVDIEEARGNIATDDINSNHILPNEKISENITYKTEEYLNSDDIKFCTDPKLKRERQKLEDLLNSYKKLINKLDSKLTSEEERKAEVERLKKIPEIYAVLHPELYRNPREEEKNKLIGKFSKRLFSPVDRIIPPTCRTPTFNISDKRQEEKERLIKIFSSCPARFHNYLDKPTSQKKIRSLRLNHSSFSSCPLNEREVEKERLSKILATTANCYRRSIDPKVKPSFRKRTSSTAVDCVQTPTKWNAMKNKEYSQFSSKDQNILHGIGEHEERRSQLISERRKEYLSQVDSAAVSLRNNVRKVDKALSTHDNESELEDADLEVRNRCNSISTQTDPPDITEESITKRNETDNFQRNRNDAVSFHRNRNEAFSYQRNGNEALSFLRNGNEAASFQQNEDNASPQDMHYLSPREKLLSDLHGVNHWYPDGSHDLSPREEVLGHRERQAIYAKALQQQIEEKRRLEEARRLREREEEERIERRLHLQQEKLETELDHEQKKRQDWLAQRHSTEEVLRRKMLELQLEAQELKKLERNKKQGVYNTTELYNASERGRENIASRPLPLPQTTLSEPSRSSRRRPMQRNNNAESIREKTFDGAPGSHHGNKFEGLRMAPLLEADRQNVLSTNSVALRSTAPPRPQAIPQKQSSSTADIWKSRDRERAEELLKAPVDFRIDRPPSPPIPAIKTRDILTSNTKVLENKWEVPKVGQELKRTQAGSGNENILTQLGAFRRQLHQEHMKLEARLQKQQSP